MTRERTCAEKGTLKLQDWTMTDRTLTDWTLQIWTLTDECNKRHNRFIFLKLQSAFFLISNHDSFRGLFDKIASTA